MKNLINRFAMMAVLGSLVCGVLVAGCGSGDKEETTTVVPVPGPPGAPGAPGADGAPGAPAAPVAPAGDGS